MSLIKDLTQQAECIACQWNKFCIEPPPMTQEQVKAEMEAIKDTPDEGERGLASVMLKAMFITGKDTQAIVCPIFATVLRASPELSQIIRDIMQGKDPR